MYEREVNQLKEWIDEAKMVVVFGGAGVSTESGLPDYRSNTGTYTEMERQDLNPKILMSKKYFMENPARFFNRPRRGPEVEIKPNAAHITLANLEKAGKDVRIITQNVDGLHQKAGHKYVIELHGANATWSCMTCGRVYKPFEAPTDAENIPRCYVDNGIVRPDVVLFGENIKPERLKQSVEVISVADLLIIAGTSLTVYPAKNLINHFKGRHVVLINREPVETPGLEISLFIQGDVGAILGQL